MQGPSATITPAGDTITLSALGGTNYQWNNGISQGIPVTPVSTNTYSVTVTDSNNCTNTDSVTVTVNPVPSVPAITQNGLSLMSSSASNNQWYMNGNSITGATAQFYTVTESGFYQVGVSNQYDCISISDIVSVQVGIMEL